MDDVILMIQEHFGIDFRIAREILYQTDKLTRCVGSTETTRSHIGIQGCKYRSCKQGYKEEDKNRNSSTLMGQKKNLLKGYTTRGV
ncbi:hypothetical protein TNCV_394031 [Trichonephila clavipes]|nr:hypothetical protein TNCV_394031 [Trichonephila clavipes]